MTALLRPAYTAPPPPGPDAPPTRVGLFIAGVQKCGTTTLHHYLAQHAALAPPAIKEPHVFDDEQRDWSVPDYRPLHALYPAPDPARLRFEATPISLFWPPALERIHAYNPAARLIVILRDPVERAWSHWCMEYARGWDDLPFAEAIRAGRTRLPPHDPTAPAWRVFSYIERGRYAAQLARARALFGAERILLLTLADLARDPGATLARVADFAGIPPFPPIVPTQLNPRVPVAWPALPTLADRALIVDALADDMAAFTAMTGMRWPSQAISADSSP